MESVHQMKLKVARPEGRKGAASTTSAKHRKGVEGITVAELTAKWGDVVEALEEDGVEVTNPGHALEGALSVRYAEFVSWHVHLPLSTCCTCFHKCRMFTFLLPQDGSVLTLIVANDCIKVVDSGQG